MIGVIIAGGAGTRLRPFTYVRPKPMMPVVNKPLLQYQVELLKRHGITDIVLCIGSGNSAIEQYFADGSEFGVRIAYSIEETPLGTAGAVRYAEPHFGAHDTMIVLNGDGLIDYDLSVIARFHAERHADVTIGLAEVPRPTPSGIVKIDPENRIVSFDEPDDAGKKLLLSGECEALGFVLVNAGLYVISRTSMERVPYGAECSIEKDFFPSLIRDNEAIFGFELTGYWSDIGSPRNYLRTHHDLLSGKADVCLSGERMSGGYLAMENVRVDPSAFISSEVHIGAGSEIRSGSRITGLTSIGPRCLVGENASIENCVLLENVVIGEGCTLKNCIIDCNSIIGNNISLSDNSVVAASSVVIGPEPS